MRAFSFGESAARRDNGRMTRMRPATPACGLPQVISTCGVSPAILGRPLSSEYMSAAMYLWGASQLNRSTPRHSNGSHTTQVTG